MDTQQRSIQGMLSDLLCTLGFKQMSYDVLKETDPKRIQKYARVVAKNWPETSRAKVQNNLRLLRLI